VTNVIGGANYDGEMGLEYFQAFPFIDHVVVSKGEEMFPELVRHILAGKAGTVPNGVTYREGVAIAITPNRSLFSEFAETGSPDYDDYYHLLDELGKTAQGLDRILLYLRVERTDSKLLKSPPTTHACNGRAWRNKRDAQALTPSVSFFPSVSRLLCSYPGGSIPPVCSHRQFVGGVAHLDTVCKGSTTSDGAGNVDGFCHFFDVRPFF
jgi:hypothetical protein